MDSPWRGSLLVVSTIVFNSVDHQCSSTIVNGWSLLSEPVGQTVVKRAPSGKDGASDVESDQDQERYRVNVAL